MLITQLSQLDLTKQYTYADYLAWRIEERIELIKGWIMRMSAPNLSHQKISQRLNLALMLFFQTHDCMVCAAPFDVRLQDKNKSTKANKAIYTVVQPDLCVICDLEKLDKRGCIGAPDLIIEILSPGNTRKEMKEKFEVYEENGVKEYWLVHPEDKNVQVYILNEYGKYIGLRHFVEDEVMTAHIFPDFKIDLNEVFKNV